MRRRWIAWLAVVVLILAACGGGEDSSETADTSDTAVTEDTEQADVATTSATEPPPASSEGPREEVSNGSDSEYCLRAQTEDSLEPIDVFSDDLQGEIERYREALSMMVENAPDEIQEDVELIAETGLALADLLEEYDFNLLAIPQEEATRLEALVTEDLEAASRRIAEFCGVEFDDSAGDVGSGVGVSDVLPDDFPEALVPPGARDGVESLGPAGFAFLVDASTDETVAYYEELLGTAGFVGEDGATIIQGTYEGEQVLATILPETPVVVTVTPLGF